MILLPMQIARIKQKRGYKDQWPHNIKLYTDDAGKNKGDATVTYEDPMAAHSAGGFFTSEWDMGGRTTAFASRNETAN